MSISRKLVAERLENKVESEDCGVCTPLSAICKVYSWTEPLSSCARVSAAELVFACRNEGYYAFDASFATETTSDVVGLGEPRKGKLIVKAPVGKAEWNFNYDFAQISSTVPNRKDDCVVDWHVRRLSSNEFVGTGKTLVSVITES